MGSSGRGGRVGEDEGSDEELPLVSDNVPERAVSPPPPPPQCARCGATFTRSDENSPSGENVPERAVSPPCVCAELVLPFPSRRTPRVPSVCVRGAGGGDLPLSSGLLLLSAILSVEDVE